MIDRTVESHWFRASAPLRGSLEILVELSRAVTQRCRLSLIYWTAGRDETTERQVDPWELACIDGQWYLIGFCHRRQAVRMFASWRIGAARPVDGDYEIPSDFSIEAWLSDAFQLIAHPGDCLETVKLRFDSYAARFIRERRWHRSQEIRDLSDGGLELSFRVASLREVERWVMSWSEHVEVLAPLSLRERIAELGKLLALRHTDAAHQARPTVPRLHRRKDGHGVISRERRA